MSLLEERITKDARMKAEHDLDYKIRNFKENMIFAAGFDAFDKHEQIEYHLKKIKELILPEYLETAERNGIEIFFQKVRKLPG